MNGGFAAALAVWDDAADLLRRHGWRIVPGYFLACVPFAATALLLLDACLAGRGGELPPLCLALVATGYVRWLGGALLQRRAALALDEGETPASAAFLFGYFWLRLRRQTLLAGPTALEGGGAGEMLANARRTGRAAPGLIPRLWATGVIFWLLALGQVLATQYFLVDLLLPLLFGFDDPLLGAVLFGRFWLLALLLFSFLGWECLWLIAGVVVHRQGAARWTGADLLARLRAMEGAG